MTIPSQIPAFTPSTDLFILASIAVFTVVGSIIGHARLKLLVMSTFVGYGLATLAMPLLHSMIGSPGGFLSLVNFQYLALALSIGILGLTGGNAYHKSMNSSGILTMVTALTAGFLAVVLFLSMLESGARNATLNGSSLASMIYDSRLAWFLAAPLLLMFGGLIHGKRH